MGCGCCGCLLWPFHLVWGLISFVFGLFGHIFGAVVGIFAFVAGVLLLITAFSAFAWLPLLIIGGVFVAKATKISN